MRVIWVAGRTRRPIIGSLQKSRENPGHKHRGTLDPCIGVFAKGAGGAAAPPVLKKFGQNAKNSGKITKFWAKILTAFLFF